MWLNRDSREPACWKVSIPPRWHEGFFSITVQAYAFDPITSFGILARPRVCLTIVTPRLSLGFLTVPQREWSLTLYQHLAGGAVAEAPFHQSYSHMHFIMNGLLYSTV
jgi:hypothetical protein